ncbi:MAG: response regulator [Thermodesulfobacteriota bacterium]
MTVEKGGGSDDTYVMSGRVYFDSVTHFYSFITDMSMPNMTGDQLAEEISSIRPDMPIVICTGFSERINKEQSEAIGIQGFLMKPLVKSDLAAMVRNVLDDAKSKNKG